MEVTMKTITIYDFNELSDEAKEKALRHFADINIDFGWSENVIEDAKDIGLQIDTAFYCRGRFTKDALEVCRLVLANHGVQSTTYKTALKWQNDLQESEAADVGDYDDYDEIEQDFLYELLEDYRIILRKEYEYLTSRIAIEETILANGWQFTEDGKLF